MAGRRFEQDRWRAGSEGGDGTGERALSTGAERICDGRSGGGLRGCVEHQGGGGVIELFRGGKEVWWGGLDGGKVERLHEESEARLRVMEGWDERVRMGQEPLDAGRSGGRYAAEKAIST